MGEIRKKYLVGLITNYQNSSNNMPLEFIGYYLPEVSFDYYEFASPLYFSDATFYGPVSFRNAKLYYEVRLSALNSLKK
jgi:hypothetical protein